MIDVSAGLVDEIRLNNDFNASACMNCGVCTATCPMGLEVLPRRLFHEVLLGRRDKVVGQTEAIFSCLLCGMCEQSCPASVPITENIRSLRHYINRTVFGL